MPIHRAFMPGFGPEGAAGEPLVFTATGLTIDTASDDGIHAASCDNWSMVLGHDGTTKCVYGDGDPISGHNGDREPIGIAQLPAAYSGGAYAVTPLAGGTGLPEMTLDGVSGDSTGGARGKCYALFRVSSSYYALVGEQPDWASNDSDQFKNVRLWKSTDTTDLSAWVRAGNVDWPKAAAATRNYAWKLPSAVGGDNVAPTRDGFFYFLSAGETTAPPDSGDRFLSSDDLMLARVPDNSAAVESLASWEFLTGVDGNNNPSWSNVFANWAPIPGLSGTLVNHWVNFIDYFADIDRYILWRDARSNPSLNPATATRLQVFEAPHPWGPWTQILLSDPWQPFRYQASNRYVFTWTVPHIWDSPVDLQGTDWTKDFVVAYSGRRIVLDQEFDALMTTTASLSGTTSGGGGGGGDPEGTLLDSVTQPINAGLVFFMGSAPSGSALLGRDQAADNAYNSLSGGNLTRTNTSHGTWKCLDITAATGQLLLPNSALLRTITNKLSIAAHVVVDTLTSKWHVIDVPYVTPSAAPWSAFDLRRATGATTTQFYITDADTGTRSSYTSAASVWPAGTPYTMWIGLTWDGSTGELKLYVNGAQYGSTITGVVDGPIDFGSTFPDVSIGNFSSAQTDEGSDGAYYTVAVWGNVQPASTFSFLAANPQGLQQT